MNVIKFQKPLRYYVDQIVDSIENGEQNPLDVLLTKVKLEKILKAINETPQIQDAITREFEAYGAKTPEYNGATLQQQETGVRYDYSGCGDVVMASLLETQESISIKIKERAKFLNNIPTAGIVDPETGAFVYPPSKSSKTIIKTTLKW